MSELSKVSDVIVVGGGPTGLTDGAECAKRGFSTLLLERLPNPGMLSHSCGAMFSSMKGLITCAIEDESIHLKEMHLTLPPWILLGFSSRMNFVSPSSHSMGGEFENPESMPVFQVNK